MLGDIRQAKNVYIVTGYTDMRKGIRSFVPYVMQNFKMDPYESGLFLFCGKKCDRLKALLWEPDGFVLLYEACAICYQAIGLEPKSHCMFVDSDEEHQRYGGVTPKELYYMYADGRDGGMSKLPLDDAAAFEEWLEQKGPHYEFNGHHPWEILPSYSTEDNGQFC